MNHSFWHIVKEETWPPTGQPTIPLSYTSLEAIKSCRLKAAFRYSPKEQYPRKMSVTSRLGIAFHKAMQRLKPLARKYDINTAAEFAQVGLDVFRRALAAQRRASAKQPREQRWVWPAAHITRMENTAITSARAMVDTGQARLAAENNKRRSISRIPLVERHVRSTDGILEGVLDRIDLVGGRPRIVDYKTTVKVTEEKITEHARQVKFYAYLWRDESGEWPREGVLQYPVAGREFSFPIEPEECCAIVDEARQEAASLDITFSNTPESLANPGDACVWCNFKPWCEPFWDMQRNLSSDSEFFDAARTGFEGNVLELKQSSGNLLLEISVQNRTVELRVRLDEFPHLGSVKPGERLRVLETKLAGTAGRPSCQVGDRTEVYTVAN